MPSIHPSPPAWEVEYSKLVKPTSGAAAEGCTALSCLDAWIVTSTSARAWGFQGAQLDAEALEKALQATVTDLPLLAGRLQGLHGEKLGTLSLGHTGEGAQLTVVDCPGLTLEQAMAPGTWLDSGFTLAKAAVPQYLDDMEVENGMPLKMMAGQVPLLMVRLTRVQDGCILGVTVSHAIKDGTRWPTLMSHLAARYRQFASGARTRGRQPRREELPLLQPTDRLAMSTERMAAELGLAGSWSPPPDPVRISLWGHWRCFKFLVSHLMERRQLLLLHLPQAQMAELKRLAAGGSPDVPVTTGDAVQAAAAMLVHASIGQPLLPDAPKGVAIMTQIKAPDGFFGNAIAFVTATAPPEAPRPAGDDYAGVLQALACAIRRATAGFRTQKEQALGLLHEFEAMVQVPAKTLLGYWYGERTPNTLASFTNYVPKQQDPDFGVGAPLYDRELTCPRTRDMAVIRPSCSPYSEGLFVQLCVTARQAARVRAHPLLPALLPQAQWVEASPA